MTSARNRLPAYLYGSLLAGALVTQGAAAEGIKTEFSGFASFVAAQTITSNQGDLDDISTQLQLNDFNVLGLRLDVDLMHNLDFTVQIRASGDSNSPAPGESGGKKTAYEPEIDWLYVGYNFTPEIRVTVGKTRLPLYIYSDVLDVGYAYQWITPPYAVYGVPSLRSNEGIEFHYTTDIGKDWYSDLTVWYGQSNEQLAELSYSDFQIRDAFGAKWAVENDWLTLRATFYTGLSDYDDMTTVLANAGLIENINLVNGAITSAGLPSLNVNAMVDVLAWDQVRTDFYGLGTIMDFDWVFLVSEATAIRLDKTAARGDLNSFYFMAGFRVTDDWTLSATYSLDYNQENEEVAEEFNALVAPALGIAPQIDGALNQLTTGVENAIQDYHIRRKDTMILTARYDFHPNAAFKAEYLIQRARYNADSLDGQPQALRFGIDLVF